MHQHLHSGKQSKRSFILPAIVLAFLVFFGLSSAGSTNYLTGEYMRGKVLEITDQGIIDDEFIEGEYQMVEVETRGGILTVEHSVVGDEVTGQLLEVGDKVVLNDTGAFVAVTDPYRLVPMFVMFLILFVLALAFTGVEAVYSFIALGFSIFVLINVIVNFILKGWNPFWVTMLGAFLIATVSVYLAHGVKKRTTVAVAGILATLVVVSILAVLFVDMTSLFGLGSEDAFFLQTSGLNVDLKGILLAGIIIGTLGVLDDITTAQAAAVDEISRANPSLRSWELYKRGLSVGREHISSLINTLVLAYAGAALPLFILFAQEQTQPLWSLLNSEFIAEEIVRTLIGSIALVLSVPITTLLAANFLRKTSVR